MPISFANLGGDFAPSAPAAAASLASLDVTASAGILLDTKALCLARNTAVSSARLARSLAAASGLEQTT